MFSKKKKINKYTITRVSNSLKNAAHLFRCFALLCSGPIKSILGEFMSSRRGFVRIPWIVFLEIACLSSSVFVCVWNGGTSDNTYIYLNSLHNVNYAEFFSRFCSDSSLRIQEFEGIALLWQLTDVD